MPQEIYPSSYVCDCGYRCEFSESTVTEVKAASMRYRQALIADDGQHDVLFDLGEVVGLRCPSKPSRKGKRLLTRKPA